MIRVQVRPNETLEAALRRFKRQCNFAGVFRMAKKYAYHEKRSDRRRREERERIRNIQRAMKKFGRKTKPRAGKNKGRFRRPGASAPGGDSDSSIADEMPASIAVPAVAKSSDGAAAAPGSGARARATSRPEPVRAEVGGDDRAKAAEV